MSNYEEDRNRHGGGYRQDMRNDNSGGREGHRSGGYESQGRRPDHDQNRGSDRYSGGAHHGGNDNSGGRDGHRSGGGQYDPQGRRPDHDQNRGSDRYSGGAHHGGNDNSGGRDGHRSGGGQYDPQGRRPEYDQNRGSDRYSGGAHHGGNDRDNRGPGLHQDQRGQQNPYASGNYRQDERHGRPDDRYSRDNGHRDNGHRDSGHRDGGHRDGGHRDGGHRDGGHRDGSHRDVGHHDGSHREIGGGQNNYRRNDDGYSSAPRNNQSDYQYRSNDQYYSQQKSQHHSQYNNDARSDQSQRQNNDYGRDSRDNYGGRGGVFQNDHGFGNHNSGSNRGNDYGRNDYGRNDYGRNDYSRNDYSRNDHSRNDHGVSHGNYQKENSGQGKFSNDGGYGNANDSKGAYESSDKAPVRAPRDWVPESRNVDDLIEETARQVEECQVSGDQDVEIRNSDIETRLTSWQNSGLHSKILRNLERLKYINVRAIQAAMIPQILNGYDVIGQAETSAGKTAAFGLPIIDYILKASDDDRQSVIQNTAPIALILAPTRELACQIVDSLRTFASGTDIKVCLAIGEQDKRKSVREIQEQCDILVGTCGRIMDLITSSILSAAMIKFLVLDEADRLLMETNQDSSHLRAILDTSDIQESAKTRQTIMTSATFDRSVEAIAAKLMKPLPNETELVRIVLASGRLSNRVNLKFHLCRGRTEKNEKLKDLLDERNPDGSVPKTLIFVQTKMFCDMLATKIQLKGPEFDAQTLHGDRSQDKRSELIGKFKSGAVNILVTTDVLSRGIDVTDLERVVNYDIPDGPPDSAIDTFIHRSGRTGRMHTGVCHSLIDSSSDNDKRLSPKFVELIKSQKREDSLPDFLVEMARENANMPESRNYGRSGRGRPSGEDRGFGGGGGGSGFGGGHGGSGFGGSGFGGGSRSSGFGSGGGATGSFNNSGFGNSSGAVSGFGGGANRQGGGFGSGFGQSNDEKTPTQGGGFGAPKAATGFGSSSAAEKTNDEEAAVPIPQGFGSKAAMEAKAAEGLGSSTFGGNNAEEKKDDGGEEEDDDW